MKKTVIIYIIISSISYSSLFTIINNDGSLYKNRKITHKENECLTQKASDYSIQAIYDEIYYARNLAIINQQLKEKSKKIKQKRENAYNKGSIYITSKDEQQILLENAKQFKGGKYIWGGTTPNGFDCSGYVQYLYKKHNISLPRTALQQSKVGIFVPKEYLQRGDLVFFLTDRRRGIPITHVGIYIGAGEFIHAASKSKGVIISSLIYGRYAKKFVLAKRVI
ncbi:MAG: C40 family peptidase [Sulfurovum sp.]